MLLLQLRAPFYSQTPFERLLHTISPIYSGHSLLKGGHRQFFIGGKTSGSRNCTARLEQLLPLDIILEDIQTVSSFGSSR